MKLKTRSIKHCPPLIELAIGLTYEEVFPNSLKSGQHLYFYLDSYSGSLDYTNLSLNNVKISSVSGSSDDPDLFPESDLVYTLNGDDTLRVDFDHTSSIKTYKLFISRTDSPENTGYPYTVKLVEET